MPTILFESTEAACDAAYMLRGEWDGLNSVIVQNLDEAALYFVADQVKSRYCWSGTFCYLSLTTEEILNQYNSNIRDFQGAYLSFLDLSRINLAGVNLTNANLAQANLQGTNLEGAILRNANLTGANLAEANLTGVNLAGAYLRKAILSQTKLTRTNLESAFFEDAIINDLNNFAVKLFVQSLFYDLKRFRNLRYFGYILGWLSIFLFGTAFIITIIYLPLLAIVFSITKGITISITAWLSIIGLLVILQYLEDSKNNLINIPSESLLFILVLGGIVSVLAELNHALRETSYMFIYYIVGSIIIVGAVLSKLHWLKRMIS